MCGGAVRVEWVNIYERRSLSRVHSASLPLFAAKADLFLHDSRFKSLSHMHSLTHTLQRSHTSRYIARLTNVWVQQRVEQYLIWSASASSEPLARAHPRRTQTLTRVSTVSLNSEWRPRMQGEAYLQASGFRIRIRLIQGIRNSNNESRLHGPATSSPTSRDCRTFQHRFCWVKIVSVGWGLSRLTAQRDIATECKIKR